MAQEDGEGAQPAADQPFHAGRRLGRGAPAAAAAGADGEVDPGDQDRPGDQLVVVVALAADRRQRGAAAMAAQVRPAVDDGVGAGVQLAAVKAAPRRLRLRRAVGKVALPALRRRQARVVRGRRRAEAVEQPTDLRLERGDPCGQRLVLRLELAVAGLEPLDPRVPLHQQIDELLAREVVVGGRPSFHAREDGRGERIGRASPTNGSTMPRGGSGHAS
jgi:hypothetical protein